MCTGVCQNAIHSKLGLSLASFNIFTFIARATVYQDEVPHMTEKTNAENGFIARVTESRCR